MLRGITIVCAVLALVTGAGMATGFEGSATASVPLAQADAPATAQVLAPGQRFSIDGAWDLEIQRHLIKASSRPRYQEVRASVALRNASDRELAFARDAFVRGGFPRLELEDASGTVHALDPTRLPRTLVPGSTLFSMAPGVPARWTVGFQVPTIYAGSLSLRAVWQGEVVATWDLTRAPSPPSGWPAPPGAEAAAFGSSLTWQQDLRVTPVGYGTRVCGDVAEEHVALVLAVQFRVENTGTTDLVWPGTLYPDVPGVAVWRDGGSARFAEETFVGTEEVLLRPSFEKAVIPPSRTPESRAMVFALPRDGRLGPANQPPQGILLLPPEATIGDRWLELGATPASLTLDSSFCESYGPTILFETVATLPQTG